MRAHTTDTIESRTTGQEEVKLEITAGKKAPHAFVDSDNNELKSLEPISGETSSKQEVTQQRFKRAVYRDARYGQAGRVWVRKHGLSQALREVYDGALQLTEGGVE